jgi:oxygen-dependent protoporphyrinogen oxidase
MSSLIEALAGQLRAGSVRTSAPIESLEPIGDQRWRLEVGGECREELDVDGVIVALPAHRAATLTGDFDPQLAEPLAAIRYNSCAVVSLVYRRDRIDHPLDGCGFVVPLIERRHILSGSYASLKYAGRAPEGSVLLRVFVGGGCHHGLMQLADMELAELAHREAADVLHIGGAPEQLWVARHTRAMPEYRVGHREHVAAIQNRLQRHPTLALAGNAYQGVGVPHCIASGAAAAERVLTELTQVQAPAGHEPASLACV